MLFLSINIKNTLNQNFFLVNTLSLQKKFIYLPLEKVEKKMGLLDLFKKKKFDETDLKSITYKRYWLDPISTILIPTDWEVSNTDRFLAKSADDRANLTVMSSEEPIKGEITKAFFEKLKGDFFKEYERDGFTALDETTSNERYISKTFQTYDEVEYHFTCAKKIDDKAIITELILRHKEPYSLEMRELVDKIGMSIQYVADFTRLFAERLITKNPNVQVRKTKGLEIEWMLKSEPGQLITSFLDNAYAEYMHRSDFYLSEIIEKYASSILETIPKEKPKPKPQPQPTAKPQPEKPKQEPPKVITPEPPKEEPIIIATPPPVEKVKEEPKKEEVTVKEETIIELSGGTETVAKEPITPQEPTYKEEIVKEEKEPQITQEKTQEMRAKKETSGSMAKEAEGPIFPDISKFVPQAKVEEEKTITKEETPIEISESLKDILDVAINLDTTQETPAAMTTPEPVAPVAPIETPKTPVETPVAAVEEPHEEPLMDENATEVVSGNIIIKKEEIFPLVRTTSFINDLKRELPDLLYENINSELGVIYLVRNEKVSLTTGDLKNLRLDRLALKSLAVQNLIDQVEVGVEEEGSRYTIVADGKFEASFLVVSELWSKDNIPVEGTITIGVPSNNVLLITGSGNAADMNWIRHRVAQAYVESNIPISDKLFEIKGNTLIPLEF